jgi:esterase/lipase superfamily enzyme
VQHACDGPTSVVVSGRTSPGPAFELRAGAPFHHTISPPLPTAIQIQYVVRGEPHAQYRIDTTITQRNASDHATTSGALSDAGTASHLLTLSLRETQAATRSGAPEPPPSMSDPDSTVSEHYGPPRSRPRSLDDTGMIAPPLPPASAQEPASMPPPPPAPPASYRRGAPASKPAKQMPARGEKGRYTVWFGTNREPAYEHRSLTGFSSERSETVHYGWCRVAIPESHTIGSIGSPWWKRWITRTDDRLKLLKLTTLPEGAYWRAIAAALHARASDERDAVVFLHGYNVSFQDAALRAAQLGFDLGVPGLMAFYSWPSKGTLHGYPADEATIEASEGYIADFLTSMAERSSARRVHIIAHSMGNRGLLRAIDRIAATAAERTSTPFDQIILAAADVDQDTFRRLSVAYQRVARRTTMYVCSKDRAVEASHWLHDFPRAGLEPPVLVVPGIDTITVSNLDLTLLGHGYVAEARELLTDIHALLRDGSSPAQRFGLRRMSSPAGEYWVVGR